MIITNRIQVMDDEHLSFQKRSKEGVGGQSDVWLKAKLFQLYLDPFPNNVDFDEYICVTGMIIRAGNTRRQLQI